MIMKVAAVLLIAVLAAACSKEPTAADAKPAAPKAPSTVKQALDGFTGKTAVKQGKRAQKQIIDISAKKNSELDEVMQ
jgi:hypothetical protein